MISKEKLLDKVRRVEGSALPGLEEDVKILVENRTDRIYQYLFKRSKRIHNHLCNLCNEKPANEDFVVDSFDTPWEDEPRELKFCSEECEDVYLREESFSYFDCPFCNRLICEQNPANGWHMQVRRFDSFGGEPICLQCLQEMLIKDGVLKTCPNEIENGSLPGMFFDHSDLKDAGYSEDKDFFANTLSSTPPIIKRIEDLDKEGYLIIIDYARMAIGGLEGTVTLWKKRKE